MANQQKEAATNNTAAASDGLPNGVAPRKKSNVRFAFACAILASMTSILLGYDIGVMSGAALFIKEDLKITDVEVEILMGILNLYSLIGSFAAGRTSDWIGRRLTIILAAVIFFVGAFMMGFSVNYPMLMAGRFVAGIGVGYALMIAPVYTAEVSPASSRGILLGYVSNYAFSHLSLKLGWRLMLGVGAAPSVVLALMVLGMPESPRWLVMKGRLADAKAVLDKTSDSTEEAALRLAEIKAAAGIPADLDGDVVPAPKRAAAGGGEERVWKELILSPAAGVRRVLVSALGIHFFQQASGIDSVVLYSPRVFQSAGIADKSKLLGTTCAVGVTKTVFILVATFTLDRFGRRPLLLASTGGMAVCLVGLGVGLTVTGHDHRIPWAVGVCIASILGVVGFFSIGLGPITWVYSSEIFPLHLRALGCALGVGVNRVTSGVISMTFLSLSKGITIGGSFFLYAGIASLAWVFFFTYLPETRGRTLEQMGELFGIPNMAGGDSYQQQQEQSPEKEKDNVVEMTSTTANTSDDVRNK
ncbi:unnamed protein product [Urochloa humidicola]